MTLKNWRLWLGIGVSTIFLVFLIWTIDLDDLARALKDANYLYIAPAIAIYFVGIYFRSLRWQYILSPLQDIGARRLYPVVVMGYAANNVLPARAGELVRSYYLAQREQVSGSSALATIGVERIYDAITLFTISVASALILLLLGVFRRRGRQVPGDGHSPGRHRRRRFAGGPGSHYRHSHQPPYSAGHRPPDFTASRAIEAQNSASWLPTSSRASVF